MATKTETPTSQTSNPQTLATRAAAGFVPGVAHLALDVVDKSQSTLIAVLQDARGELRAVVDHGIDFAEKGTASLFRFARTLTRRVDEGVAETLASTARLVSGAVTSARDTTRSATDTANTALSGITGAPAAA